MENLEINILKIRKAFSDPKVPHNPPYFITFSDLQIETGLTIKELTKVLKRLEEKGILFYIAVPENFPPYVEVNESFRELMGVDFPTDLNDNDNRFSVISR